MSSYLVQSVALKSKVGLLVAALVVPSLLAVGCSGKSAATDPQLSDLDAKAVVHTTPNIGATVSFSSPARTTTAIETAGVCMPALLLYRDASATTAVWDQQSWYNTRAGGCKWMLDKVTVPGETSTPGVLPHDILGDSLPAGVYAARVRVIIGHTLVSGSSYMTVVDEMREVPAGTVTIGP